MKLIANNRIRTCRAIQGIIELLAQEFEWFKEKTKEEQLKLAMLFFNCERGRLQNGKMVADVIMKIIPLIISVAALIFALKK